MGPCGQGQVTERGRAGGSGVVQGAQEDQEEEVKWLLEGEPEDWAWTGRGPLWSGAGGRQRDVVVQAEVHMTV